MKPFSGTCLQYYRPFLLSHFTLLISLLGEKNKAFMIKCRMGVQMRAHFYFTLQAFSKEALVP